MTSDSSQSWDILFGDLATGQMARVRDAIVSVNVSYSSTMCTQLQIELIDTNFEMLDSDYFLVGRDIVYRSKAFATFDGSNFAKLDNKGRLIHLFEIASVEVRPSSGSSPSIVVQARTKAVQQMKRDKDPGSIKGKSSDFVINAAKKFGLLPIVQKTTKSRQINKASGDRQADSTWDVLSNLANDAKFMLFETDGMLFFCSMDYLMGRWGVTQQEHTMFTNSQNKPVVSPINVVPLFWPPLQEGDIERRVTGKLTEDDKWRLTDGSLSPKFDGLLRPLQMPTVRRSDNDPFVVSGSASVDRYAGIMMRPGMTLFFLGIPTFTDIYMISDVTFDHFSAQPVSLEFTRPEREAKYIKQIGVNPAFADYGLTTEASPLIAKTRII